MATFRIFVFFVSILLISPYTNIACGSLRVTVYLSNRSSYQLNRPWSENYAKRSNVKVMTNLQEDILCFAVPMFVLPMFLWTRLKKSFCVKTQHIYFVNIIIQTTLCTVIFQMQSISFHFSQFSIDLHFDFRGDPRFSADLGSCIYDLIKH